MFDTSSRVPLHYFKSSCKAKLTGGSVVCEVFCSHTSPKYLTSRNSKRDNVGSGLTSLSSGVTEPLYAGFDLLRTPTTLQRTAAEATWSRQSGSLGTKPM